MSGAPRSKKTSESGNLRAWEDSHLTGLPRNKDTLARIAKLRPSTPDAANLFDMPTKTFEDWCVRELGETFAEFRNKYVSRTRGALVNEAIYQALSGNNAMLIFCLKNLAGWTDKVETEIKLPAPIAVKRKTGETVEYKQARDVIEPSIVDSNQYFLPEKKTGDGGGK